ncbi:MAG: hypothetical protein ACOX6V_00795 [Patescibacteria group bacterium]|jgi:hypothetical protein
MAVQETRQENPSIFQAGQHTTRIVRRSPDYKQIPYTDIEALLNLENTPWIVTAEEGVLVLQTNHEGNDVAICYDSKTNGGLLSIIEGRDGIFDMETFPANPARIDAIESFLRSAVPVEEV